MSVRVFAGGVEVAAFAPGDRGLAYGDGLFETMRVHQGGLHWWEAHWSRLQRGARRLGLPLPDEAQVRDAARSLFDDGGDGVLKLLVTRGEGGRGYAPPATAIPAWQVSRHALPAAPRPQGLVLRWCELRLGAQPALAGIKHCNRLEQVLARAEWNDAGIDEGLLCDAEGNVVSATAGNVFALQGGRWRTPAVDRCGVAGVCREWILGATGAEVAPLQVDDIEQADALLLCNAVRGILPVARLAGRAWAPHPMVAALRARLAAAHPAFTAPEDDA